MHGFICFISKYDFIIVYQESDNIAVLITILYKLSLAASAYCKSLVKFETDVFHNIPVLFFLSEIPVIGLKKCINLGV